jgi:hypothetical protein
MQKTMVGGFCISANTGLHLRAFRTQTNPFLVSSKIHQLFLTGEAVA